MYEPVWQKLVTGKYNQQLAQLAEFKRVKVKQATYPVIIEDALSTVNGIVYFDVSAQDVERLDMFEGEYYQRKALTVTTKNSSLSADCYLLNPAHRHICSTELWCEQEFINKYLANFVESYLKEKTTK